jgi:hypothetical protein
VAFIVAKHSLSIVVLFLINCITNMMYCKVLILIVINFLFKIKTTFLVLPIDMLHLTMQHKNHNQREVQVRFFSQVVKWMYY